MISQKHFISRRHFLVLAGASAATGIVAACGGAAPTAAPTAAPKAAEATKPPEPTKAPEPTATVEPTKPPEPTATAEPTKAPEQYLIIGRGGDTVLLDAAICTDGESARVCIAVGDSLTHLEGKTTKVVPWLAESWTTADSKVWDFKLRSGVKFHDGEPLTAAAAKWNFDRWMNIGEAAKYRYPSQKYEYWDLEMASMVDKVEAVDDLTLRLTLKDASALILVKLCLFNFAIASPKAIMEQGEKYGTQAGKPVGVGRFIFDSWIPNDKITVVRNEDWWGGKVKLDYTQMPVVNKIIWRSIPDNNTRFAEYQAGTLDIADLAQTDAMTLEGNADYVKVVTPSLGVGYIAFNQAMKPFDKVEVREAWAHAVDWDSLIKTFYGEYATRASCFQPPAILGHNPNIKAYEFDQAKAKELLAKAGLPNGFTTDFWYIPVIRGYFPESKALSEAMAADLAKVGIKLNLKTQDWGAYLAARKDGKFPVWALGWGSDNGDPDNFIGYHFIWEDKTKPNKEDSYNNPKLQELLYAGRLEPDPAKRETIYQEAEQIVHDDVPRIPVAWPESVGFNRKELKGYHMPPWVFHDQLEYMYMERKS
jgi:peptide/nickel transport system substrate-binding protein